MKTKMFPSGPRFNCWILLLTLSFLVFQKPVLAQSNFCEFDALRQTLLQEDLHFHQQQYLNETLVQEILNDPVMMGLISNADVYTIPVVVHVMHLGETMGTGSNISDTQIAQAIADLNADFSAIDIQFCLAQRDPEGMMSTGINRVNAAPICAGGSCFGSGMPISGSLTNAVKAASLWPNTDYINIWVVHEITGALGYATFPGASANTDGIVIDSDYFGIDGSNILAHEAGHFFNLYHSFEGDCPTGVNCNVNCNLTVCPPPGATEGDMVMDTRPHKRSCNDCDLGGTNACDNNSSNALFVPNFMNYAEISCLEEFTDGQRDRMRCALMELRAELLNSLGCFPACTSVVVDFDPSLLGGPEDVTITFENTTTNSTGGAMEYLWTVEDVSETTTDLTHVFENAGSYSVCLTASSLDCTNRKCKVIEITSSEACFGGYENCNLILNGNLEQSVFDLDELCHLGISGCRDDNGVCNWIRKRESPVFCSNSNGANSLILGDWGEAIVSLEELDLEDGKSYTVSFEYYYVAKDMIKTREPKFSFGLIESTDLDLNFPFTEFTREIGAIENPPVDEVGEYLVCATANQTFHYYEISFIYHAGDPQFLYFTNEWQLFISPFRYSSFMHLRNIVLTDCGQTCTPIPDIAYLQDSCSFNFIGTNSGDQGTCFWDFGDGTSATGCNVTHDYLYGSTFDVCLTIVCDENASATVCETITIPEECEDCQGLETAAVAVLCEQDSTSSYLAKVDFEVPKGQEPCTDNGLFFWSDDAQVVVTSFDIEPVDNDFDRISACFAISPYPGYDFETNGTTIYVTLCDSNGEMLCYTFEVSGKACDQCLEISVESDAVCNDPDPFDDIFIYEGNVEIPLDNTDFTYCGSTSTEVGYSDAVVESGGQFLVTYTITTTTANLQSINTVLCFLDNLDNQACITLTIPTLEPCPVFPTECVQQWAKKPMECNAVEGGYAVFNFTMNLPNYGYQICNEGLFGNIDGGGTVQVNSGITTGNSLYFDVDIFFACGFDPARIYYLRLYLCDEDGDYVCFLFPFHFSCDKLCGNGDGSGNGNTINTLSKEEPSQCQIYPNPAEDKLSIEINTVISDNLEAVIFDHLGKSVATYQLKDSKENLNIQELQTGLYFLRIMDNGIIKHVDKLIVLK